MSEISQELTKLVEKMPAFSNSVHQILQLTADINSSPKDLIEVIERDPVLTFKVLKLVNSAYFGLSREVTSIKKSVVYIGLNSIRNVAISLAAIGALPKEHKASSGYIDNFWRHSLETATLSRLIGRKKSIPENILSDYFVAGLLHDIGQLTIAIFFPDEFKQVLELSKQQQLSIQQCEQQILDTDHAQVGAMLAAHWKLPDNLVQCIRHHHSLNELDSAPVIQQTLFVANQASKILTEENQRISLIETAPDYILQWLGMPIQDILDNIPNVQEEIEKSAAFINS